MRLTDTQSRIIFGLSFLLSAFLQFWKISTWSFWFDESYTSALVHTDLSQIISLTSLDVHPPLYYLVLHLWAQVFGTSDLALRSLSALLMLLSVLLLVLLLKKLVEKRLAYVAASFAALAPFTIRYGQEARMYAMVSALVLGATYVFIIQMQRKRRERSLRLWLVYALLITLALYTHYFSVLIVVAHLAYALFHDTRTKDGKTWIIRLKNRLSLVDRRMLKSMVLIPILYAPWLPTLKQQFSAVNRGFWIPDADLVSLGSVFTTLTVFQETHHTGTMLLLSYLVVALFVSVTYKVVRKAKGEDARALWFVLACFLFPLILLFVMSLPSFTSSYFYFRYFAQFSMFFYAGLILVAMLAVKHLNHAIGWSMFVLLIGLNTMGTVRVLNGTDKNGVNVNQQFEVLKRDFQEGDEIVAMSMWQWFNAHHYNDTSTPVKYADTGYYWGSHAPIYEAKDNILTNRDLTDVNPSTDRVWVIEPTNFTTTVPDNWQRTNTTIYGKDTNIVLFEVN